MTPEPTDHETDGGHEPASGALSPEMARNINSMIESDEFAETLFDPDEVTVGELTKIVRENQLVGGDGDEVQPQANLIAFGGYVLVFPS